MEGKTLVRTKPKVKTMKIQTLFVLFAVLALSNCTNQTSADIVIDDFSTAGVSSLTVTEVGTASQITTTTDQSILGDEREEVLNFVVGTGSANYTVNTSDNLFVISQGVGVGLTGSLTYNNIANFDLTDGGVNDQLTLDVRSDIPFALADELTVSATSGTDSFSVDVTIPPNTGSGIVNIAFADFDSVDFTDIDELQLNFDFTGASGLGRDVNLSFFAATSSVPEPSSLTVLGLISGVCLLRRRR